MAKRRARTAHAGTTGEHGESDAAAQGPLNLARATPERAAEVLSQAAGVAITARQVREDIRAGLPANDDGTVSLITYAAWLAGRVDGD